MTIKLDKHETVNFILVSWLVVISGNVSIASIPGMTYLTALVSLIIIFKKRDYVYLKRLLIPLLVFFTVFLGQYFTLKILPLKYPIGFIVTLIAGTAIYHLVGIKFRKVYLNVVFFFCIVSLFFWTIQNTIGITFDLFGGVKNYRDVLIWSVRPDPYNSNILEFRNGGPVWEPGAFAGYIIFLFLLYIDDLGQLWRQNKFKICIIFIGLITTFSTTGYVLMMLILLYQTVKVSKISFVKLSFYLPVIILTLYLMFVNIEFLQQKIITQFQNALLLSGENYSSTRLGSLLFDLQFIIDNPIFGNGVDPRTRWQGYPELYRRVISGENLGHGNGFSGFIVEMGLLSFLYLSIKLFIEYKNKIGFINAMVLLILFILLLQGESFLKHPLLLGFFFIKLPYSRGLYSTNTKFINIKNVE